MAETAIQPPSEASKESQEILAELEKEGKGTVSPAPTEPDKKPETPAAPAAPIIPDEKKPDADPGKKPDADRAPDRTVKAVPVGKYNDERHKRQEAEAGKTAAETRAAEAERLLAEARATGKQPDKPTVQQVDDVKETAAGMAKKFGLNAEFADEFVRSIVTLAEKRNVLPAEMTEKLAAFDEYKAKAEKLEHDSFQQTEFENEFTKTFDELKDKFPDMASHKQALKDLAFVEGNENTPLRRLTIEYFHDNPPARAGRPSAEKPYQVGNSGDNGNDGGVDFATITTDQVKKMSGDEFDKYLEWQATQPKKK